MIDRNFITEIEKGYFRTNQDVGANPNALFIWNLVRKHVGLPMIQSKDLPAFCKTHQKYHVINKDYGCERKNS